MDRVHRRAIAPLLFAAALALTLAPALAAQQETKAPPMSKEQMAMMEAMTKAMTPGANHQLLSSFAGNWMFTTRMWTNPSAPPTESNGTATYESIMGGRYVRSTAKAMMMGMPFEGGGIDGFDNVTGQFVSTWIDNFGTGITTFSGKYDPATKTITYSGEMADMTKPMSKVRIRQTLRIVDDDHHEMSWYETRNGKEAKTMEIVFTRSHQ